MLAVSRAQALAKDGLAAVRQSVKALREEGSVDGIAQQIASLVESARDERFRAALTISGTPRPVSAAVALALHRTTLEALTNVRKHADAENVEIGLAFRDDGVVQLRVHVASRKTSIALESPAILESACGYGPLADGSVGSSPRLPCT